MDHSRRQCVEEVQTYEVQSRLTIDQTAAVLRLAVLCENRQIDPVESRIETGAPDDIGDVHHSTVYEQRLAIAHTDHAGYTLYTGGCEIPGLDANPRRSAVQCARPDLAAKGSLDRQQAMKDISDD